MLCYTFWLHQSHAHTLVHARSRALETYVTWITSVSYGHSLIGNRSIILSQALWNNLASMQPLLQLKKNRLHEENSYLTTMQEITCKNKTKFKPLMYNRKQQSKPIKVRGTTPGNARWSYWNMENQYKQMSYIQKEIKKLISSRKSRISTNHRMVNTYLMYLMSVV